MAIQNPWWAFRAELVDTERDAPGVYELEGAGTVIYIGGSEKLRARLKELLNGPSTSCIKKNAVRYRVEYARNFRGRAKELINEFMRLHGKPPLCNADEGATIDRGGRRAA